MATAAYITATEAAARLRVSVRTLRDWSSQGLLPRYLVGSRSIRYLAADVDALVVPEQHQSAA